MEKVRQLYMFGGYDGMVREQEMSNSDSIQPVRLMRTVKQPPYECYVPGTDTCETTALYDDYIPHKFVYGEYCVYLMVASGYTIEDALKRLTENYLPTLDKGYNNGR